MSSTGNQGRGHTIRRRPRDTSAREPVPGDAAPREAAREPAAPVKMPAASSKLPVERDKDVAALFDRAPSRSAALGTRPSLRGQETLKVGGHVIRVERDDDDRVHLVLGGVFRLVMTAEEARQLVGALSALGGDTSR